MAVTQLLPVGIQDFASIREGNYLYIDKTEYIFNMITQGKPYFLSRPRRFGKSLLISTLYYIFTGQRRLFKDLWIDRSNYEWTTHPVIRLDMSLIDHTDSEMFNKSLIELLVDCGKNYQVEINASDNAPSVLKRLIHALNQKHGKVVVLIDEYNKPMLDHITNTIMCLIMRDLLRQFYTILKGEDEKLRLVFLTGVTKFSKVSVFSGLNNLDDLSLDNHYSAMLGYTQEELTQQFAPWITMLAEKYKKTVENILKEIQQWYNGYLFSAEGISVYNPFSTLMLFKKQFFRAHWFSTGTPTFLMNLIKTQGLVISDIQEENYIEEVFTAAYDIDQLNALSLMYQTGYLTIKSYDFEKQYYQLKFPNREVEQGISQSLLQVYAHQTIDAQNAWVNRLTTTLENKDYDLFFILLKGFLANILYDLHIPLEKYYQTIFYLLFNLIGMNLQVEVHTNCGRIDAVLEYSDHILLFEFKLDKPLKDAFYQIVDKNYPEKYLHQGKMVLLFAVTFSVEKRNIADWAMKSL